MIIVIIYSGLIRPVSMIPFYAGTEVAWVSVRSGNGDTTPCVQSAINPHSCAICSHVQYNASTHNIKIHCTVPWVHAWCVGQVQLAAPGASVCQEHGAGRERWDLV